MSKVALLPLSLCIGCFYLHGDRAIAQVTTDNTTNTEVNQNGSVTEITGGAARGSNLFHSFEDFSVPAGNAAFFDNASDISNIFSRVTGGNVSNIDGTLRTNDANLFLINPAGIMFGAGARLDLGGGSFYGTTAESILFDEGEFSAADTDSSPLLTINAPIGLNFRNEPGDITVLGDGNGTRTPESPIIDTQDALRVDGTATIGIIGGNINFDDATVKTAGGRIEIGSVAAGRVDLVAVESGFSFNYDNITNFDDVLLSGNSVIDASGAGSGNLQVGARNLSLTGSSGLLSATLGAESGGGIDIFAAESIEISGVANNLGLVSTISSLTFPQGTADAGDINLETGSLRLGDRALISTSNLGAGNSGNINITATDTISLAGEGNTSTISTGNLNFNSATDSGLIDITTNSFTASGFSSLSTLNSGLGAGGNIAIEATGDLSLSENSSLLVRGSPGGAISLTGRNLTLNSGGNLIGGVGATNSSDLVSGDITIDLSEDLTINGLDSLFDPSRIENPSLGAGDSGNIEVNARNIRLTNGGVINSFTLNNSDTGSITLNASNDVSISGIGIINIPLLDDTGAVIPDAFQEVPFNSSIRASASPNSMGNGGSVNINAANFT
ncbi:MAG: filamentous hemagglutinin N-terminal domain-containing protein, partial [Cyanobacteria bacterium J06623_7]